MNLLRRWAPRLLLPILAFVAAAFWWTRPGTAVARHRVEAAEVVDEVAGNGVLDAHLRATIGPRIAGRLRTVAVDQGDAVQRGQVVATLEDADLQRDVEVEAANVAYRQASLERMHAEVASAKAGATLAGTVRDRLARLIANGTAATEDLERAEEARTVADANVRRAEASLVEGRRLLAAAEAALARRRTLLEDATLRAPFDAVVLRRDRHPGDVVVPGSSILALAATDELWVGAWIDETRLGAVRPGQAARVVFRAAPQRTALGKVVRIGRETDAETRETRVDVAVPELPANWSVGQRADVVVEAGRRQAAATFPAAALAWREGGPGVFVEERGAARWRPVRLGFRSAERIEATEGVAAGTVVLAPADPQGLGLADGQRVAPP